MTEQNIDLWLSDRTIPEPNSGCLLWTKYTNEDGYGRAFKNGVVRGAHRLVYEMVCGPIPEDMVVMHKCDVRCCVNINHLQLGTQTENISDATKKGRMKTPTKGKWWIGKKRSDEQKIKLAFQRSKLTLDQIKTIKSDTRSNGKIAAEYGVERTTIQRIKSGKSFVLPLQQEELQ